MNNELKTFVQLKYEILSLSDRKTWHLVESYPAEVCKRWAWRCAADLKSTAQRDPVADKVIQIANLYQEKKATIKEMDETWVAWYTAYSRYAMYTQNTFCVNYAHDTISSHNNFHQERYKIHTEYLIKELCRYESNHNE